MKLDVLRWDLCKSVRYTLDGSTPNENSRYVLEDDNVMNITESTFISGRCQDNDGRMDEQITNSYFEEITPS